MLRSAIRLLLAAMLAVGGADAVADKRTMCTITVNSTDERDAFRRHLPQGDYEFVELVERGRPDWLASACRQHVQCDVLVISGHFNGHDFFSDALDRSEYLPVAEIERASCSGSCPALFSRLKEVYLFGCDTLNPHAVGSVSADVVRSLVDSGHSRAEAERIARRLGERHIESNRDVMRRLFPNVPAIHGFSSVAPLGATAGPLIGRYFRSTPVTRVGSGHPNRALLDQFAAHAMSVTSGLKPSDPRNAYRGEVCRFVDDRTAAGDKLRFVHDILGRDAAEGRMFFDRIEHFLGTLSDEDRQSAAFAAELDRIAKDPTARDRYLRFARSADAPSLRVRMTDVAHTLGWLSEDDLRRERASMIRDLLSRPVVDVPAADAICALNHDGGFDGEFTDFDRLPAAGEPGHGAALACLGSAQARARMLAALASPDDREFAMAKLHFHHRPLDGAEELRTVAAGIAQMTRPDAQVRALHALARQNVSHREGMEKLVRLFVDAESADVRRALADVFVRADMRAIATPELLRVLRERRPQGDERGDIIDILIRRLERFVSVADAQPRM